MATDSTDDTPTDPDSGAMVGPAAGGGTAVADKNDGAGRVAQIIGPVVDVEFDADNIPEIMSALEVDRPGERLVLEVQSHRGNNVVRTIAMQSTEGWCAAARSPTPARPSRSPSASPPWAGCSTSSATPSTASRPRPRARSCPSTDRRRRSPSSPPTSRSSRPGSRSSTCWSPSTRAPRSASSAAPAWARPCW